MINQHNKLWKQKVINIKENAIVLMSEINDMFHPVIT